MTNQAPRTYYPFDQAYDHMTGEVERQLRCAPPVIRGYTAHLTLSRGKFIRACALLTCSMDEEGLVPEDAVMLAAAIELLHLATLVHDDVIDNADMRRGVVTLQKKYGKKIAVICGDYLLSAALKMVTAIPDRERFLSLNLPDYISRLCLGELRQEVNQGNLKLSLYRYLSIISGKTAALFEAAFYGGAVLHTDDRELLSDYRKAGRYVGMIFQLTDDCIDYEVDQETAKKNVRSDYDQGVVTLPLIYTLNQQPELADMLTRGELGSEELYPRVRQAGGLDFTRRFAHRYYQKAVAAMDRLKLPECKRSRLMAVLDKAYYGLQGQNGASAPNQTTAHS